MGTPLSLRSFQGQPFLLACRSRLAAALVKLNLAILDGGGGAVKVEGKFLVGRHGEGQEICFHHRLHAKGGSNGVPGVGTGDADYKTEGRY